VAIDSEHRFEADFPRKIHDIANETEPIVLVYVRTVAIDECRLAAIVSARNCLSSHFNCPLISFGRWEAAGVPPPLLKKEEKLNKHTITFRSEPGMLRLDCRSGMNRF
jgi:hypothetical protein